MTKPLFIIGFMGAGKTTLVKDISKKYNIPLLDSDTEIEKQEGISIEEIFKLKGEHYFRGLETNWVKNLTNDSKVVSCGGGLPCFNDNIILLKQKGEVIYLDSPNDLILERILEDTSRPLVRNKSREEILELKRKREIYYHLADKKLTTKEDFD